MKPLTIAVAGLGTVGAGVCVLLQKNAKRIASHAGRELVLRVVSDCDASKNESLHLSGTDFVTDARTLVGRSDVDVIVELIGGADGFAYDLCTQALAAGQSVVTANKAMLAKHGYELSKTAKEKNVSLLFEAAVGGGIPVLKVLRESLAANEILSVRGILNGTCNYILTRMGEEGLSFDAVLADAQKFGYAEADPSADVDGFDTAHKLALLSALAFGIKPDMTSISIRGIRDVSAQQIADAKEMNCKIKLLGSARKTEAGIEQKVEPVLLPMADPLALVDGVLNAIDIEGDAVGPVTLVGRGAGAAATASAVVGDLIDIARGFTVSPWGVSVEALI